MRFTVAICTWNRASLLSNALDQLTHIERPRGEWELIVVNNGSTDDTERVLSSFEGRLPICNVFEARPGLSHARNAAVVMGVGDYFIWTDDDTLVDVNWLAAYERAIDDHPEAAVFGGPVRPSFEGTPPPWVTAVWDDIRDAFAARDLGDQPFRFTGHGDLPYGANFVIRAREQRMFAYDPKLGRKRDGGAVGEETAVIRAILEAGGTGWWVPNASVEHWIPKVRQTVEYLRRYYALQGKTFYQRGHSARHWLSIMRAEAAYSLARLSGDPHRWIKQLIHVSILRGAAQRDHS